MQLSFANLLVLARLTLHSPAQAVSVLQQIGLPMRARWIGFWIVAVLSALVVHLEFLAQPLDVQGFLLPLIRIPFVTALMQAGFLLLTVVACFQVGRGFGGRGSFADSLLVLVWLQTILIGLQILQLLVGVVMPLLADLLSLITLMATFWLVTHFIAALHGFRSLGLVFLAVIVTLVGMVILMAVILALFIGPQLGV